MKSIVAWVDTGFAGGCSRTLYNVHAVNLKTLHVDYYFSILSRRTALIKYKLNFIIDCVSTVIQTTKLSTTFQGFVNTGMLCVIRYHSQHALVVFQCDIDGGIGS